MATLLLCPHTIRKEKKQQAFGVRSYMDTKSIMRYHPHDLIYTWLLFKGLIFKYHQSTITLRVRILTYKFCTGMIKSIADCFKESLITDTAIKNTQKISSWSKEFREIDHQIIKELCKETAKELGAKSTKYWFSGEKSFRKLAWLTVADSIENSNGKKVENWSSLTLVMFMT